MAIDTKQNGKSQCDESSDDATSSSSSSISAYAPTFRTRAKQLSATAPPYLTKANTTDRPAKTKITSPRQTRAAKKAADKIPPINNGEDDESDNDSFE